MRGTLKRHPFRQRLVRIRTPKHQYADKKAHYDAAYALFINGKYSEAREKFELFLKTYPQNELSDNAQFWIGETYYREKDFESAILSYETLLKKFPKSQKAPSALLKQGLSFVEIGDPKTAKVILDQVVERFPDTNEATDRKEENRRNQRETEPEKEKMSSLRDGFHRTIDYLRISVTDKCNLRCIYCMPSGGVVPIEHKEILRYEEIARILKVAAKIGVRRVRITGGEPLVRKDIAHLVHLIKQIPGIRDLSLTTNGILLEQHAEELAGAGLNRVNVSLDSLSAEKYGEITRGGNLDAVLRGIQAAEKAGLVPVKINMVPIRGINDSEIEAFAKLTLNTSYQIRFIEFMPFDSQDLWSPETFCLCRRDTLPCREHRNACPGAGEEIRPCTLFQARRRSGSNRIYQSPQQPFLRRVQPASYDSRWETEALPFFRNGNRPETCSEAEHCPMTKYTASSSFRSR